MDSSLDHLDNADFDLEYNDPMQDVNQALAACASTLDHWAEGGTSPQPMSVYPVAVVYDSANQRTQQFNLYLERNPSVADNFGPQEWAEEEKAFGIMGNAVAQANQRNSVFYMVSMQNMVFSHSWYRRHWGQDTPELRERFQALDREWHEFVIVLDHRKVYIYDPSYAPEDPPQNRRRALRSIPLMGTKALKMLQALRNSRHLGIDEVYIGGGGNTTGECRRMSLQWIRGLVTEMVTTEQWDKGQIRWERVNNS